MDCCCIERKASYISNREIYDVPAIGYSQSFYIDILGLLSPARNGNLERVHFSVVQFLSYLYCAKICKDP